MGHSKISSAVNTKISWRKWNLRNCPSFLVQREKTNKQTCTEVVSMAPFLLYNIRLSPYELLTGFHSNLFTMFHLMNTVLVCTYYSRQLSFTERLKGYLKSYWHSWVYYHFFRRTSGLVLNLFSFHQIIEIKVNALF